MVSVLVLVSVWIEVVTENLVDTEVVVKVEVETSVAVEVVPVKIVENSVSVDRADERLVTTVVPILVRVVVIVWSSPLCFPFSRLRLCFVPAKRPMNTELRSKNRRHARNNRIVRGVSGSRRASPRR